MIICIEQAITLKPGSALRDPYTKPPFALDFRVWMFNLTNEEEVIAGNITITKLFATRLIHCMHLNIFRAQLQGVNRCFRKSAHTILSN